MKDKTSFLDKLLPAVSAFQQNIYVSAITEGMLGAMPVLMASAVIQLVQNFPVTAWTNLLQSIGLYDLFATVVSICNMTALFITFPVSN